MRFDTDIRIRIKDAYAARHEPEAMRVLARLYWTFLVVVFAVLASAGIGFGVWEFFRASPEEGSLVNARPQTVFTKADLQTLLAGFADRATRFDSRMAAPVNVSDPR